MAHAASDDSPSVMELLLEPNIPAEFAAGAIIIGFIVVVIESTHSRTVHSFILMLLYFNKLVLFL